jgi:SAM-dependent methyltransferase
MATGGGPGGDYRLSFVTAIGKRVRAVRAWLAPRRRLHRLAGGASGRLAGEVDDPTFIRWAYRMLLQREPDPGGRELYLRHLAEGTRTRRSMLEEMRASDEFWFGFALRYEDPIFAIHRSRSLFVRALPRAATILDLGGTHLGAHEGAFVRLGYPYPFERLVIIDLPSDDRHELYQQAGGAQDRVDTAQGPVEYAFHSMADLSRYPDASFDLVYSGQSIEHVAEHVADVVIAEVQRVLRPGGWFCLDTPNGRLCKLQLEGTGLAVTNPDHDIEYEHSELVAKLERGGFDIVEAKGLVLMQKSAASRSFSFEELATNAGVFDEIEDCYLLAYICRKPA